MADYITTTNFKLRHGITTTTNDARIALHVTAASRRIDGDCGRSFEQTTPAANRYFWPSSDGRVWVDDAYGTVTVTVDQGDDGTYSEAWTVNTDYTTEPYNGVGPNGQSGWPTTCLIAVGTRCWPTGTKRPPVKVNAQWGWAATPSEISEACYLMAHRLYYEVGVPSGAQPPNLEFGVPGASLARPYTYEALIEPYVRTWNKVGIA